MKYSDFNQRLNQKDLVKKIIGSSFQTFQIGVENIIQNALNKISDGTNLEDNWDKDFQPPLDKLVDALRPYYTVMRVVQHVKSMGGFEGSTWIVGRNVLEDEKNHTFQDFSTNNSEEAKKVIEILKRIGFQENTTSKKDLSNSDTVCIWKS